jgi:hypothetical protein
LFHKKEKNNERRSKMGRKSLILLGVVLFVLGLPVWALADSISPDTFSASIAVGGTATVDKTVSLTAGTPTGGKGDVFFLADTTGSMGSAIASVKTNAASIMSTTNAYGDMAYGVGAYRDVGDAYVYHLGQAVTTNTTAVQTAINAWVADGGGDGPEAQLYALSQVAGAGTGWRAGSEKIVLWFGDYEGHDPSNGITEAVATTALVTAGIKVEAISVGANRLNFLGQAQRIADATGGDFYSGINQAALAAAIQEAIAVAFSTYTSVGLDLSEVPAGLLASYGGAESGSWTRETAHGFNFAGLTFTGVTPGTYDFNVYAIVDGGRVATETEHIVVGAVPEPGTLLLLGAALIGLVGLRRKMI